MYQKSLKREQIRAMFPNREWKFSNFGEMTSQFAEGHEEKYKEQLKNIFNQEIKLDQPVEWIDE